MTKLQTGFSLFAVLALLAVPSAALAASSEEGYGGPNNVVSGVEGGNEGTTSESTSPEPSVSSVASSDDSGLLPFTGADLAVLAGAGLVLFGFGYGLRRVTRHPSQP